MAWSRLSTARHFPTAVAAAVVLGALAGGAVHAVAQVVERRAALVAVHR